MGIFNKKYTNLATDLIATKYTNIDDFSYFMSKNLIEGILNDVLARIVNLDLMILDSMHGNTAVPTPYKGLIELIVEHYLKRSKSSFRVDTVENALLYIPNNTEDKLERTVVLDFYNNQEGGLLISNFNIIHQALEYLEIAGQMSGHLVLGVDGIRGGGVREDLVRDSIANISKMIRNPKAIIYTDSRDTLTSVKIDTTEAERTINLVFKIIANLTGLPLSYIYGEFAGGIATTGEGDNMAIERALESYYIEILKPILMRIAKIIGASQEFSFKPKTTHAIDRINAFTNIIMQLEATEILTTEEKEKIKQVYIADVLE